MVDVSNKAQTARFAIAEGWITMQSATLQLIMAGTHRKGDVLGIARIAGIMAAKKTAELIPLCHPLPLTAIEIELRTEPDLNRVYCKTQIKTTAQTGIEIEALCATQISLLTIYDMCKAVDRGMEIQSVRLIEKAGGQSGHWQR